MQSALYVGWTGHGNLGDEAMLEVCEKRFSYRWIPFETWNAQPRPKDFAHRAMSSPSILLKSFTDELRTRRRLRSFLNARKANVNSSAGPSLALLGGGTLINATDEFLEQYRTASQRVRSAVPVFSCGVKTPDFFAGKGEWLDRSREWIDATSDLSVVGVRGPLSREFLESAGARNVRVTGDPAVWLHEPLPLSANLNRERPFRIGVNCGSAKYIWGDLSQLLRWQAEIVQQLVACGHKVELFAICPEDMAACKEVARLANVGIAPISEPLTRYAAYKARLNDLDVVFAVKLHAAVLAACANVPFIMLEYQPKCRDFCASIDWETYNVRTDCASAANVLPILEHLLADLTGARTVLCRRMCELRKVFESYCEHLENTFAELSARADLPKPASRDGQRRRSPGNQQQAPATSAGAD